MIAVDKRQGLWVRWIVTGLTGLLIILVVILGLLQQARITNILAADKAHQAQAAADAKDADARYSDLFTNYSNLYKQLGAHGVTPTAPAPSEVEQPITGATGATGAQGPGPTVTQIFAAVTSYCSVPGICLGPPGPTGAAGTAGAAGQSVVGPAGAAGTNGTNGLNGADGRGVTDVSCVLEDDLSTSLRFTFTDQTTEDVPASCIPPTPVGETQ